MRMADYARASVLLVGDIDRGGLYASFLGTWMSFTDAERRLLTGYIVNRFRGDASLLGPAHDYMLAHTGVPVLGTIPYIRDLNIPEEDMAGFSWGHTDCGEKKAGTLDIAVVMLRHVSNYTDFAPLAAEPDVRLRPVRRAEEWGDPDVVMLPGSKSVVPDLDDLRRSGLADNILGHAERGKWIFGICGGLQILGRAILDPHGIESAAPEVPGLGLMDLRSTFAADKTLVRVARAETPLGVPSGGYEIHHGLTDHGPSALPLFLRADRAYPSEAERICGYVSGRRWATYLHGVFDDDTFRRDVDRPCAHRSGPDTTKALPCELRSGKSSGQTGGRCPCQFGHGNDLSKHGAEMNPSGLALLPAALPMDCLFGEPQNRIRSRLPERDTGHPSRPPTPAHPQHADVLGRSAGETRRPRRIRRADRQSSMARGRNHGTFTDTFFSPYVLVWHGVSLLFLKPSTSA